jgi:antitoxin (DNA-binding transcriptional repressor) of toxin-antitoxin stability system
MKMLRISASDNETKLRDIINAAIKGESIVILTEEGDEIQLIPVSPRKARRAGTAEGLIWIADDFDAPLDDFEEYM